MDNEFDAYKEVDEGLLLIIQRVEGWSRILIETLII